MKYVGLDPIVTRTVRIRVLGSFPGQESLRLREYYAFRPR